ncbi:MAG: hypothetical protein AAF378_16815 [Cyanobacteria bacterium P01_A01_bin.84]
MIHTYEVFVDMKGFVDPSGVNFYQGTTHYEINAVSKEKADDLAFEKARSEHPDFTEYDVRITRQLK